MRIQYLYWAFVVVAALYIAYFGRRKSKRWILAVLLVGIFLFLFGFFSGLAGDFSSGRLFQLLMFHENFIPYPGVYTPIALGYALVSGGLLLCTYRLLSRPSVPSNPSLEKDA
jgi:hypothetical protein